LQVKPECPKLKKSSSQ